MCKILLVFVVLQGVVNCARILGWFSCPSISHQIIFQPIWKELSLRGHEVTVITSDPLKDPTLKNLTEIDVEFTYKVWQEIDISHMRREVRTAFEVEYYFQKCHERSIEMAIETKEIQEILKKPENYFDLILIEAHQPILYGLHYKFKAPLISISSLGIYNHLNDLLGNPTHPALYTDFISDLSGKLTFWEKVDNLHLVVGSYFLNKFIIYPHADKVARLYFGEHMPYIEDIVKNTSLQFSNVNPVFSDRRPLAPNVMQFFNVHVTKKESLSKDLQDILDSAKNGVVYFSLGTNVRFDHVQGDIKKTILQALGELPYTVLCKWESEDFPGKPKNVVLRKWFPQQSILAHPNVKVFVTQGGLQSSEEAISNGIPLVVIPFLGDQPMNARILTTHGMAETILPKALDKDVLKNTILKVAKEEKYRQKAKELRSIFLDQPQSGVDKIVWWCEYVIRHKGAKHLRSPGADIPLYEYFMLDVLAVILGALFVIYKVISLALRTLLGLFKSGKKVKQKKN